MPYDPKKPNPLTRKADTPRLRRQWNAVHESSLERGDDEGTAIAKASGVVKKEHAKEAFLGAALTAGKAMLTRLPGALALGGVGKRMAIGAAAGAAAGGLTAPEGKGVQRAIGGGLLGAAGGALSHGGFRSAMMGKGGVGAAMIRPSPPNTPMMRGAHTSFDATPGSFKTSSIKGWKLAYDYDYEVSESEKKHTARSKDTPPTWLKSIGIGAGVGAAGGAAIAAIQHKPNIVLSRGHSAAAGAILGGGIGALGGAVYGLADRAGIAASKDVMELPQEERHSLLRHRARREERASTEARAESRHQELLDKEGSDAIAVAKLIRPVLSDRPAGAAKDDGDDPLPIPSSRDKIGSNGGHSNPHKAHFPSMPKAKMPKMPKSVGKSLTAPLGKHLAGGARQGLAFDAEAAAMKVQRRGTRVIENASTKGHDIVQAYQSYAGSRGVLQDAARRSALHGFAKAGFERLGLGREALKRGLMPRIPLDDVKQLSERAVRIPKLMQLTTGKGPIVSKANSWRKLTARGGKFEDAERALSEQVAVQIPFQAPGTKTVTFREKKAGMFGRRIAEFTGIPGDVTKKLVQGRIGKRLELDALTLLPQRGG